MLTEEEQHVVQLLADAWNAFLELPVLHPWHGPEFMHAIHAAQRIVMVRPVLKEMREEGLVPLGESAERVSALWEE